MGGGGGGGGLPVTCELLVPRVGTRKNRKDRHRTIAIKVVGSSPVQNDLRALQLAPSAVVGNKVTKTVSTEPAVEND